MVITASQIQWTSDVTKALASCKERGNRSALKSMKKKQVSTSSASSQPSHFTSCTIQALIAPVWPQVSLLQGYSELIRGNLAKVLRLKVVALVTVEVHARDVIDKLGRAGCSDANAFEWLSQLRLYWEKFKVPGGEEAIPGHGLVVLTQCLLPVLFGSTNRTSTTVSSDKPTHASSTATSIWATQDGSSSLRSLTGPVESCTVCWLYMKFKSLLSISLIIYC